MPNFADWYSQGGQTKDGPAIVALGADRMGLGLFARGTDDALHWRKTGAVGDAWSNLGGQIGSQPSCISRYDGGDVVDCFARGSNLGVWKITIKNGVSGGWKSLGGQILGSPSAVKVGGGAAVLAIGVDGELWGVTGGAPAIIGADYTWGSWTKIEGTGPTKLTHAPGCLATGPALSNVTCMAPSGATLQNIYPFVAVGQPGNHFMISFPISTDYVPAYVTTGTYKGSSGYDTSSNIFASTASSVASLSVITNLSVNNKSYAATDLGGLAVSGPSCAFRGVPGPQPRFACAVRGTNGAVWVREFQLAS